VWSVTIHIVQGWGRKYWARSHTGGEGVQTQVYLVHTYFASFQHFLSTLCTVLRAIFCAEEVMKTPLMTTLSIKYWKQNKEKQHKKHGFLVKGQYYASQVNVRRIPVKSLISIEWHCFKFFGQYKAKQKWQIEAELSFLWRMHLYS
jgi:hypothetical protein